MRNSENEKKRVFKVDYCQEENVLGFIYGHNGTLNLYWVFLFPLFQEKGRVSVKDSRGQSSSSSSSLCCRNITSPLWRGSS